MTIWAVLAGGKGLRYGGPKINATHAGETFLDRVLGAIDGVRSEGDFVVVSLGDDTVVASAYGSQKAQVHFVRDAVSDAGPAHSMGRLAAFAIENGSDDLVVTAVDMLGVTSDTLTCMRNEMRLDAGAAVVARHDASPHWVLNAVPRELLSRLADNAASVNSLQSLFNLMPLRFVDFPAQVVLDVNTPELLPRDGSG